MGISRKGGCKIPGKNVWSPQVILLADLAFIAQIIADFLRQMGFSIFDYRFS
jgi:hypothetical protein